MKNKSILYIIVIIVVAILLVGVGFEVYDKKTTENGHTISLKFKEIANIKRSEVELPDFKIDIDGAYFGTLNDALLEAYGIQVYEFDAAVDNGWDIVTNHYIGVKFRDVLDIMIQEAPLTRLEFQSKSNRTVIYNKDEITDNFYLVFNRDDKPFGEKGLLSLLVIDYKYKYSLENVAKIFLTNYDPFENYDSVMSDDIES